MATTLIAYTRNTMLKYEVYQALQYVATSGVSIEIAGRNSDMGVCDSVRNQPGTKSDPILAISHNAMNYMKDNNLIIPIMNDGSVYQISIKGLQWINDINSNFESPA